MESFTKNLKSLRIGGFGSGGGEKMRKIKSESSGTSTSWLRKMRNLSSNSKSRKSLPNTPTDSTITNPTTHSSSTDMARLKLNFGHEPSHHTLTYHHVTPCNCKLSYCTSCSRNSVCRSLLSHESAHTRTSLGLQDHPGYHHMAPAPPKLHNMIRAPQDSKKPLYRAHSARLTTATVPAMFIGQQTRRESISGYGTNGSSRSSRVSLNRQGKANNATQRCLNPDDVGEMKRNQQIKARNCYLLEKNLETLSENEKIIRRSLEKVDKWLRQLPPTFSPIHDVMTPYSLIENRV